MHGWGFWEAGVWQKGRAIFQSLACRPGVGEEMVKWNRNVNQTQNLLCSSALLFIPLVSVNLLPMMPVFRARGVGAEVSTAVTHDHWPGGLLENSFPRTVKFLITSDWLREISNGSFKDVHVSFLVFATEDSRFISLDVSLPCVCKLVAQLPPVFVWPARYHKCSGIHYQHLKTRWFHLKIWICGSYLDIWQCDSVACVLAWPP